MVSLIKNWSTTAGDNDAAPPNGAPEGMAPSAVNNIMRQMMAQIRAWYEEPLWIDFGHSGLTYVDATNFRVTGDHTAVYLINRRIRAIGTTPFTRYGTISAVNYSSPDTTVTVVWDGTAMDNTLSEVAVGPTPANNPLSSAAIKWLSGFGVPYASIPAANQAEAEAGTENEKFMTPLRTKQAIDVWRTLPTKVYITDDDDFELAAGKTCRVYMAGGSGGGAGDGNGTDGTDTTLTFNDGTDDFVYTAAKGLGGVGAFTEQAPPDHGGGSATQEAAPINPDFVKTGGGMQGGLGAAEASVGGTEWDHGGNGSNSGYLEQLIVNDTEDPITLAFVIGDPGSGGSGTVNGKPGLKGYAIVEYY